MIEGTAHIVVTDVLETADVELISAGLDEFNMEQAGVNDRLLLAVFVKDSDTGWVVGGLAGRTSFGFYQRNGWQVFGEVPSVAGTSRLFLTKSLS